MAAGEEHEDVLEAGLARAEVFELTAVAGYRIQKRGYGEMRLADTQADGRILATDRLYAGQRPPALEVVAVSAIAADASVLADLELDHVMASQPVDKVGGSAFGDDFSVIDDGQPVAEAFGLVHVVRGEQDSATFFLEGADDVPELAAALGIESGGGLVEKKNARIADQCGGDGQALLLAAGKFADPGVGFLGELEFFEDVGGGARFAVEAGEEFDGLADV